MVRLVNCRTSRYVNLFSLEEVTMFRKSCFLLTTIFLAITLIACSGSGKKWNPEDYTVKSGDTVYSIAWRYEIDPEQFAAWNNISPSKLIKPGQRLHTRKPYNFDRTRGTSSARENSRTPVVASKRYSSNEKWVKAQKGDTLYALSKRYGVSVQRLAQLNQLKKPYVLQPGQTIFLKPLNKATATATNKAVTPSSRKQPVTRKPTHARQTAWPKQVRWRKPVRGKVIKKFNRNRNDAKGIDIAGNLGDAITASADGKIVYSGDGLISYGNLIIIKHNKTYLSAYAYNHKNLVKEGETVKAGQKIAEMGRKDKLSARLHFEIRKNGKPVDPLKYLPW